LDQESVEVDFGHTTQEFALDSVYDFRARCTLVDPSTHATQGAALGAVLLGSLGLISAIAFVASDEFDTSFGDAAQLFGIPTLTGALVGGLIGAAFPKRIDWRSVDPRTAGAGTRASPLSISLAPTPGEPGAWSVGLRVHLGR
jgi:hypothetical protein